MSNIKIDKNSIVNALTIDVEDYFQVSAFSEKIKRNDWDSIECRVEKNIDYILGMLDSRKIKATFFTLGWIAERYPEMIKKIISEGHELASHGYEHQRVTELSRESFYQDVSRAKGLLEDVGGEKIHGYRAPSFSINESNLWAMEILLKTGHRYSSSIYPVKHDHYGSPEAPRFPYKVHSELLEIPPTTIRFFNHNIPASGGGYFRLLPYSISKWMLSQVNNKEGKSAVFYFHPWEIDKNQPEVKGLSIKDSFRHYVNIKKMEKKLKCLFFDFNWNRMDKVFL
jgi:polysaccharide deacetylase family protein (PEP-CTERM system associated)